jgi:hypothetical protein
MVTTSENLSKQLAGRGLSIAAAVLEMDATAITTAANGYARIATSWAVQSDFGIILPYRRLSTWGSAA